MWRYHLFLMGENLVFYPRYLYIFIFIPSWNTNAILNANQYDLTNMLYFKYAIFKYKITENTCYLYLLNSIDRIEKDVSCRIIGRYRTLKRSSLVGRKLLHTFVQPLSFSVSLSVISWMGWWLNVLYVHHFFVSEWLSFAYTSYTSYWWRILSLAAFSMT